MAARFVSIIFAAAVVVIIVVEWKRKSRRLNIGTDVAFIDAHFLICQREARGCLIWGVGYVLKFKHAR